MQSIKFYNILYKGRKKGGIFQRAKNTQNKSLQKQTIKEKVATITAATLNKHEDIKREYKKSFF